MVNPTKTNDFIEQDILCDETRMLFFSCIVKLIDKKIELTSKQIEQRELNACRTFIDTHQKRRAIYNRIITSTARDVTKWLCKNFSFFHNRDQSIRPLNEITVYELLTKGKGEPTKGSRICAADWLPYKSPSTLDSKNKNK